MVVTIDSTNPRDLAALALLLNADTWQKRGQTKDGRRFYAVPSRSRPGLYQLTDGASCTCEDFTRNGQRCAHARAAALYRVRQAGQPRPSPRLTERQAAAAAKYAEIFGAEG